MAGDGSAARLIGLLPMDELLRIDAGFEGDWTRTAVTIWTREHGCAGFDGLRESHPEHVPSLELVFPDHWLGLHCFARERGVNVFDARAARAVVALVELRLAGR